MIDPSHQPLALELGGVAVAFEPGSPSLKLREADPCARFLSAGPAEMRIRVCLGRVGIEPPDGIVFASSNWTARRQTEGWVIQMGYSNPGPDGLRYTIIFDDDGLTGKLYIQTAADGSQVDARPFEVPPAMLDEVMAQQMLANRRGLMLHACGVAVDGQTGYLFAGVSGSGKTTTARLWQAQPGVNLLGDERLVVRRIDGQYRLFSTPWHSPGFQIARGNVPLRRLFILEHAQENQARPLGLAEAVASLLPLCYLPVWDRAGMDFTLEFLEDLCRSLPIYRLGFTPDQRVVEYVRGLARA